MKGNSPIHTESDSISKDIFDRYYRLITELLERRISGTSEIPFEDLEMLQKVVEALERNVIDITSDRAKDLKIVPVVVDLLESWLFVINNYIGLSRALAYNLFAALFLIENIATLDLIKTTRFLKKIKNNSKPSIELIDPDSQMLRMLAHLSGGNGSEEKVISMIAEQFRREAKLQLEMNDKKRNDSLDQLSSRHDDNYFKIKSIEKITNTEIIEEIRNEAKKANLYDQFERLFEFDDSILDAVWDVKIVVEDTEKFDAAEIGFLLWSFSKSIESIEGIEVTLERCAEGSKIFNLKIRIGDLTSKIDLLQIFKKVVQGIQVYHTKKPMEELEKLDAEANKLLNEAEKVKRETNNIQSEDNAKILNDLAIHDKVLELQLKELEYQDKMMELKRKQFDLIKMAVELMVEGFVQNNSDIQIYINNVLLASAKRDQNHEVKVNTGAIELIDVEEKFEAKRPVNKEDNAAGLEQTI